MCYLILHLELTRIFVQILQEESPMVKRIQDPLSILIFVLMRRMLRLLDRINRFLMGLQ